MRTHTNYTIAVVLALAAVVAAIPAFAQSAPLRANIPFDFYVADRLLPAGTYTITPSLEGNALRVSGSNGNSALILTAGYKPSPATENNRLMFHRYGTTSFLSSVYWVGYRNARELVTSPMEQRLAKNGVAPLPVAIVIK